MTADRAVPPRRRFWTVRRTAETAAVFVSLAALALSPCHWVPTAATFAASLVLAWYLCRTAH